MINYKINNGLLNLKRRMKFIFWAFTVFSAQLVGCINIRDISSSNGNVNINTAIYVGNYLEPSGKREWYYRIGLSPFLAKLEDNDFGAMMYLGYIEILNTNKYLVPGIEYGLINHQHNIKYSVLQGLPIIDKESSLRLNMFNIRLLRYITVKDSKTFLPYLGLAYGGSGQKGEAVIGYKIPHFLGGVIFYPENRFSLSVEGRYISFNTSSDKPIFNYFGDATFEKEKHNSTGYAIGITFNYLF